MGYIIGGFVIGLSLIIFGIWVGKKIFGFEPDPDSVARQSWNFYKQEEDDSDYM